MRSLLPCFLGTLTFRTQLPCLKKSRWRETKALRPPGKLQRDPYIAHTLAGRGSHLDNLGLSPQSLHFFVLLCFNSVSPYPNSKRLKQTQLWACQPCPQHEVLLPVAFLGHLLDLAPLLQPRPRATPLCLALRSSQSQPPRRATQAAAGLLQGSQSTGPAQSQARARFSQWEAVKIQRTYQWECEVAVRQITICNGQRSASASRTPWKGEVLQNLK